MSYDWTPAPSAARRPWVLALVLLAGSVHAQSLAKRLDARLDAPPFDRQLWGVALVDDRGRQLYGRNERRLFTPASDAKIVVTAVASALLPPDWTVRTSVYAGGPVVGGILQGDLVLYGRGDPTMSQRCYSTDTTAAGACDTDPFARLRELADTLKAHGIREVHGDVVGDGSYFEPLTVNPNWEVFDLNWWYAAAVSGLGFNDNSVDFFWGPGVDIGAPAVITMSPDLGDISFENRTVTVAPGGESDIGDRFYRTPGTMQVWAEGTVTRDHPTQKESFAIPDPNLFTARALRQMLAETGIAVTGTTAIDDGLAALSHRARRCAARGSAVAPPPRLGLPDPQYQPELVRRDAAQTAGSPVREGRLMGGGPRGRAPLPHRLGEGGLDPVLTARWLGTRERKPHLPARVHPDPALHPCPPAVRDLRRGASTVGSDRQSCAPASSVRRWRDACAQKREASVESTLSRAISRGRVRDRWSSRSRPITIRRARAPSSRRSIAWWWRWEEAVRKGERGKGKGERGRKSGERGMGKGEGGIKKISGAS